MTSLRIHIPWIILFSVLIPCFYVVGIDLRSVQANFFQLACIAILGLVHVNRYIGWFILFTLGQYIIFPEQPFSYYQLESLAFGALVYHFIVKYAEGSKGRIYLWALLGLLIFNCFWAALQAWQIDPIFSQVDPDKKPDGFSEYAGFFALPAFFGNYGATVLPISYLLMPVTMGFSFLALWCAKSTFSVMGALGASLFYFWFRKRVIFWMILIVGGIATLAYAIKSDMPSGQFGRRMKAWNLVLKESFKTPWKGHGLGSVMGTYFFTEVTPTHEIKLTNRVSEFLDFLIEQANKNQRPDIAEQIKGQDRNKPDIMGIKAYLQSYGMDFHFWKEIHNEFLQVFFEQGLFAILIVILYFINLFRRFYRFGRNNSFCVTMGACVVSLVIVSSGHFPFHVARLAAPFIVILALFDRGLISVEGKEENYPEDVYA